MASRVTSATSRRRKSYRERRDIRLSILTQQSALRFRITSPRLSPAPSTSTYLGMILRSHGIVQPWPRLAPMAVSRPPSYACRQMPIESLLYVGTQWGQGGCESACEGARDVVSILAITASSRPVTVAIGENEWTFDTKGEVPISCFEIPFDGETTGPVRISLGGKTTEGPPIVSDCHEDEVSNVR